jgi:DNA-binding LacI/PurR family transcriptional regulator
VVGVTDRTERRQIPGVYADSVSGTDAAMDHLWELGHRAIICVSDSRTYDGRLRADRYERYMHARGMSEYIQIHITDQEPDKGYELGRRIFDGFDDSPTTAVFATSDTTAFGLMRAAYEQGITIPDRLSIVGYDDIDVAPYVIPPLTTVSQEGMEMGRSAAELLFRMIAEDLAINTVQDVVLEPRLVVRQSTSTPREGR